MYDVTFLKIYLLSRCLESFRSQTGYLIFDILKGSSSSEKKKKNTTSKRTNQERIGTCTSRNTGSTFIIRFCVYTVRQWPAMLNTAKQVAGWTKDPYRNSECEGTATSFHQCALQVCVLLLPVHRKDPHRSVNTRNVM